MITLFSTSRQIILASQSPRRQSFLKDIGIEYFLYHDLLLAKGKNSHHSNEILAHSSQIQPSGVRAKDDTEGRPKHLESPESYVSRAALEKILEAIHSLGFTNNSVTIASIANDFNADSINGNMQGLLNSDKKEIINLSYPIEKYPFQSNTLQQTVNLPSKSCKKELKTPLFITADTIVALGDEILGKPHDEADALNMLRRMVGRKHRVLTSVCVADLEAECVYSFTDTAHVHFAPWSTKLLESYIKTGDPMDKAGSYGIQGIGMFLSDGIQGSWDTVAGLPMAKLLELLFHCKAIEIAPS